MASEILSSICKLWTSQIRRAQKSKRNVFDKTGDEVWKYLNADYKGLYLTDDDSDEEFTGPHHQVRLNKSREFVSLFVPFLHHKVPHRQVEPSRPQIPPELLNLPPGTPMPLTDLQRSDRARAWLMQWFLNYIPDRYDLRGEVRKALPEALCRGRCILWHGMFDGPTGPLPGSFYESVNDLIIDPDARQLREAGWIALRRRRSIWKVAEETGISRELLKASYTSSLQRSAEDASPPKNPEDGDTIDSGDIIEYWDVYSRIGIGSKFHTAGEEVKEVAQQLDALGPYIHLKICPGMDFPLNLPPHAAGSPNTEQEYLQRLQWPIPFYENPSDPWPFSNLDFIPSSENAWAVSPLEGALPLQRFIDNVYSYATDRVRTTCRDIIITAAELDDDLHKALESGRDQETVVIKGSARDAREQIHVLQFPEVNKDLWHILGLAENAFERISFMSPLLSGAETGTQIRSASEFQGRQSSANTVPDDYAECVERFMGNVAAKESVMARLMVDPAITLAPLFGEQIQENQLAPGLPGQMGPLTQAWSQLVSTTDPAVAAAELSYSVEAGSGRRKNKAKATADATMFSSAVGGPAMQLAGMGEVRPWNAILRMLGEAADLTSARIDDFMIPPPQPQQPPPNQQSSQPSQQPTQAAQPQQTA